MLDTRTSLLAVEDLQAWYGESHILHGVSFDVHQGEVVTLLGRNGAGKTTTLKSIMGIVGHRTGSVRFQGEELIARSSNQIARAGLAFCPEERGVFASLNVEENLLLPPVVKPGGLGLDQIFELFPNLKERLGSSQGTKLSGGEQQMLAIGRILRTGARLLLLDEPGPQGSGLYYPIGGTKFPLRLDGCGPLLRDGTWPYHRPIRQHGTGCQRRKITRVSRFLTKSHNGTKQ